MSKKTLLQILIAGFLLSSETTSLAAPQKKVAPIATKIFSEADKMNERDLYAAILNTYNRNDQVRFLAYYRSFKKRFAKSPLADEATYLNGLYALSEKQYGKALVSFNEILTKYSFSNKTTAAMYAKGITLKRMNLKNESQVVFRTVLKKYSGSPEALRARVELGLVK